MTHGSLDDVAESSAPLTGGAAASTRDAASLRTRDDRLLKHALELCASSDADALWGSTLAAAVELAGADGGSLWLAIGETLRCGFATGDDDAVSAPARDLSDLDSLDDAPAWAAAMAAPIVLGGATRAVVRVQRALAASPRFDGDDRRCLGSLAASAAAALAIVDRGTAAQERTRSLALVAEMSREITSTLDLDRVLRTLVNLAARALPCDRCAVALYEEGECDVRAVAGAEAVERDDPRLKDLAARAAWAAGVKQTFYLSDREDPGSDAERIFAQFFGDDLATDGMRSGLYIPLDDEEGVVGILLFESSATEFATDDQREIAAILAHQATVAIRNARLYSQVPLADVLGAFGDRKRALLALPRRQRLAWGWGVAAALALLTLVRWPLRVDGQQAVLRPAGRADVRPLVGGVVERVLAREGAAVARDAPLLELRSAELHAERDAVAGEAEAATRLAALAASRGDAATEQVERIRAASARQQAAVLDEQLRATVVRAPAAGIVLTARPEERAGSRVEAGDAVLVVGRADTLELEFTVGQRDVARVRPGQPVRLRVDALPQRTFAGTVASVAALPADSAGAAAAFSVRALVPNEHGVLRPGMTPYVRVLTAPASLAGRVLRAPARWLRLFWWRLSA